MTTSTTVHRPFGVSLLSILLIISGVVEIVAAIVLLVTHDDEKVRNALSDVTSGNITALAVTSIVIGVIVLLVAFALRRGAEWARLLIGIIAVARVAVLVWAVIGYHGFHWYQALLPAAIYLLVAGYLFSDDDVKRYFGRA